VTKIAGSDLEPRRTTTRARRASPRDGASKVGHCQVLFSAPVAYVTGAFLWTGRPRAYYCTGLLRFTVLVPRITTSLYGTAFVHPAQQPLSMNLRPGAAPILPLPPGIGIYTIHQPNDSVGTAQSHRNTQRSFPRKRESSIDAGYLDSRLRGNDDLFEMCRYLCLPGEAGPKGRVRERPPGSWTQFVAETRPGGLSRIRVLRGIGPARQVHPCTA